MSEANLELVLQALRNFESEDFETVDETWHEDGVISGPEGWPEPGPFEGRDAVRGQFERLASDFGEHSFRDVDVVAQEGEWVVVAFIWDVRGAGSGAAIASRIVGAYRIVEGLFKEAHFRWTTEDALEAAGLKPAVGS